MSTPDLEPAARQLAALVAGVGDGQLGAPTPCPAYTLGDLLDHVGGLSLAFTGAATKATGDGTGQGPSGDASRLGADWRAQIPRPDRSGRRLAGPRGLVGHDERAASTCGAVAGVVALDEIVLHGWDVAGQRAGLRRRSGRRRGGPRVLAQLATPSRRPCDQHLQTA
jgi:uncharacterized protein (TIGR03086 family)